jgi:hypothetical protein
MRPPSAFKVITVLLQESSETTRMLGFGQPGQSVPVRVYAQPEAMYLSSDSGGAPVAAKRAEAAVAARASATGSDRTGP